MIDKLFPTEDQKLAKELSEKVSQLDIPETPYLSSLDTINQQFRDIAYALAVSMEPVFLEICTELRKFDN